MAVRSERRFENVDLLMSLMGDNKKHTNDVFVPTTKKIVVGAQEPLLRKPAGRNHTHTQNHNSGSSAATSPVPSIRSATSSSSSSSTAPPPYQARQSLDTGSSAVTSTHLFSPNPTGGPAHYRSSSDLPAFGNTKPLTTRSKTTSSSIPPASTGLKALFQAPVVLGGGSNASTSTLTPTTASTSTLSASRRPSTETPSTTRPISSSPSPILNQSQVHQTTRPALPEMNSISSLNSRFSRSSAESHSSASAELKCYQAVQPQSQAPAHQPLPSQRPLLSTCPGGGASNNSSSNGGGIQQRSRPASQPLTGRDKQARDRSLSQLFVYQPRVVNAPSSATAAAGDAVLYELDGVIPTVARPTEVVVSRPRKTSEPNPRRKSQESPKKAHTAATTVAAAVTAVTSQLPDPGSRRHELDSAAWQRRTRLFQVEEPKKGDHGGLGVK